VYFIEGFYLYAEVGASGRGLLASSKLITGTIRVVPVCVRRTLQRGPRRALIIGEDSLMLILRFSIKSKTKGHFLNVFCYVY
jgi:hypothetical protein